MRETEYTCGLPDAKSDRIIDQIKSINIGRNREGGGSTCLKIEFLESNVLGHCDGPPGLHGTIIDGTV